MSEYEKFLEWYQCQGATVPPRLKPDERLIIQCILDGKEMPPGSKAALSGPDFSCCLSLVNRFRLRLPPNERMKGDA